MPRRFHGPPTGAIVVAVALIQVLGTLFAAIHQEDRRPLDALAILLLVAGPAALWLRKPAPGAMLPVTLALTGTYIVLDYAWGPIALSLAISIVLTSAAGLRWQAWAGAGVAAAGFALFTFSPSDGTWAIRASTVGAWAAILVIIGQGVRRRRERFAEYRRRREAQLKAERDEYRLNLARDIHDVVAHSLSMINVQASVALHLGSKDPERLRPALEAIKEASKESLLEVRQLLGVLRDDAPLGPAERPGLDRLHELVEAARLAGIEAVLDQRIGVPVARAHQEAAYRIVQEALTNVARHSGATTAVVLLETADGQLTVTIDDDGAGLRGAAPGNGLRGMKERAAALGGSLTVEQLEPGLRVRARLPLGPRPEPGAGERGPEASEEGVS
ncbi:sensor histidine kinase [Arthrobacter sp. M4]|uniref:sensor histidine kinase n=1 Tax=Arthrobacter sp. M4 TaxID=218160 RepID=UPI001CDB5A50|nr:sensor histidine kinase [Arthrobacter sp. M4]MCA4133500.1 sensor histidine kinase [Arthrobacter sp. M4]